ncbi:MAG TPA: Gfo/Idh/MocA family oxidoreductase [Acidimicrobiales bacterium]|nr:Gfo/Idh/MocA family oxidoreductase [Acidimicrobiales bacterium]
MAGAQIRVGFLGAGLIATFHSKMLRRSGEAFARAGVYDPDPARAEAFARASGSTACATEEEVLDGCDAVYVCTWTSEHPRLVDAAAERGLAVFCEKPLATSLDGARRMRAAVDAAQVPNQVGLVLRRSPAFTMLRELAHAPEAGRIMTVVFRDDQYIPVRGMYASTWRGEVDKAGAGALLEHSIHDVDILEAVVGPILDVSARSAEFHGLSGIEDLVVATFAFQDGAIGSLTSVWHDIDARGSLRRIEVFCERALFTMEGDWFGPLRWERDDGAVGSLEGDALVAAAQVVSGDDANPDGAFLRAVREGHPCTPDFATAVRAHEVTDALYNSARAGGAPRRVQV